MDASLARATVIATLAASPTEHSVTDDIELLIAAMAREEAHHNQCSLAAATRQIRGLVAAAREEYRAAGAPYGEDDRGFCRLPPRAPAPDTYGITWRVRCSPPKRTADRLSGHGLFRTHGASKVGRRIPPLRRRRRPTW
jgi:hypothetical protein